MFNFVLNVQQCLGSAWKWTVGKGEITDHKYDMGLEAKKLVQLYIL